MEFFFDKYVEIIAESSGRWGRELEYVTVGTVQGVVGCRRERGGGDWGSVEGGGGRDEVVAVLVVVVVAVTVVVAVAVGTTVTSALFSTLFSLFFSSLAAFKRAKK